MECNYKKPKPGVNYDDKTGKLFVFSSSNITVMKAWPPMAWKKTWGNPNWVHVRPEIRLPQGNIEDKNPPITIVVDETNQMLLPFCMPKQICSSKMAWIRWSMVIPIETRDVIRSFKKRQWHMLSFLARCGDRAYDLTVSNPALAFALASNWVYRKPAVHRPLRSARALLKTGKKQRDILNWLHFPGTESTRKILAKIVPASIDIIRLLYLRQALKGLEMRKTLCHLNRINAGSIRIISDPDFFSRVTMSFMEEIANCRKEDLGPKAAYILEDCVTMYRCLFPTRSGIIRFKSLAQLEEMHDSLTYDLNRAVFIDRKVLFPPSPLEGNEFIVPISNSWDLIEEGRKQHNCVSSYMDKISVYQQIYVYRVLHPERCTLSIQRHGNRWVFSELKKANNKSASKMTHRVVEKWLKRSTDMKIDVTGL